MTKPKASYGAIPDCKANQDAAASAKANSTTAARWTNRVPDLAFLGVTLVLCIFFLGSQSSQTGPDLASLSASGDMATLGHSHSSFPNKRILRALKELDQQMDGSVVFPTMNEFANASKVWNQHRAPSIAVVLVENEGDVQMAMPVLSVLDQKHGVSFRFASRAEATILPVFLELRGALHCLWSVSIIFTTLIIRRVSPPWVLPFWSNKSLTKSWYPFPTAAPLVGAQVLQKVDLASVEVGEFWQENMDSE